MLSMEDKGYEEMEDILGIDQGNLRVKMNRIKEKLLHITKNDLYGTGRIEKPMDTSRQNTKN